MDRTCDKCGGKKTTTKVNLLNARTEKIKCPKCNGTGSIPHEMIKDGTVFFTQECITGYWQELKDGKAIATMMVLICPVIDKFKNHLYTVEKDPKNLLAAPIKKGRYFVEIISMSTRPAHRRQGIMSRLVDKLMEDPKIERAETNWDDSTADGRNFCISKGFVQEDGKLILRNKLVLNEPS